MTHNCTEHCSNRATPDSLTALGFPVRVTEKCVGAVVTTRPGMTFEDARHAAWTAGVLRLCTRTERRNAR